ncbi:ankyrin repeat-containing protein ITN1 [Eucalyptus grandis]|uniref:ankyrin repeat-containing protein ITN1 n=1 Tax=Eucalyptus grandis TaxID=71139 RepID=UPI00192ECB0D|nr:ankyrin repeat-containing protein ITN1 [Eucalyptus grandis]
MTGNHTETPMHIAAMLGHLKFVEEVLARKPELVKEQDSQSSTPLHLAAAKGYHNIVASLLRVDPEICFVRDKYERNPLHVAAMKGHVDVLELLVRTKPDAARSVITHGQTIMHLCVKHNRLEALKLLMDILGDYQFINLRDEYGNTILHLAAADKQTKTIVFLIDKGVDPNIKNSRGFTALGLLAQGQSAERVSEIMHSVPQTPENLDPSRQTVYANNMVNASHPPVGEEDKSKVKREWQNNMHKTLVVVAVLLATMAFQASITPPGGLWQDDLLNVTGGDIHYAGESIMADKYPDHYEKFITCNTIIFVTSLSIIMLFISGLPLEHLQITTWIAMLTTWVAIIFTAVAYSVSIWVFTPDSELHVTNKTVRVAVLTWVGLMAFIFLCHIVRFILKMAPKVLKFVGKASIRREPEGHIA